VPQFHDGKGVMSFRGKRRVESALALAPWVMLDLARILRSLQKLADGIPVESPWTHPRAAYLDSMSLGEWLTSKHALGDTRRFVGMIATVHWGAPVGDVSLMNVARYIKTLGGLEHMLAVEGGDQQDRVLGTVHALVKDLADRLQADVIVDSPVERITTADDRVTVQTHMHTITARYVVVTASPVHRSTIEFDPALPAPHQGLARSWRLGALSKAFVAYERPFWRRDGLSGESVSDNETVFLTFDVGPDADGPGVLMVFCDARGFDGHGQEERRRRVVRHLEHLYGPSALDAIDYVDFAWGTDSFAAGGPNPAVGPGTWTNYGRFLREPVGRVHWAGSETAHETSGTMNGAILSGERAAAEVVARLVSEIPTESEGSDGVAV
jgi:monoamine oxidase